MSRAIQRETDRLRTVDCWLEKYGARAYALLNIWFGTDEPPIWAFENTFIRIYRNFKGIRFFPSVHAAVVYHTLLVCAEAEMQVSAPPSDTGSPESAVDEPVEKPLTVKEGDLWRLCALSGAVKPVVLGYLCAEGDLARTSSMLSRPKGYLLRCLENASKSLWGDASTFASCSESWTALQAELQVYLSELSVPEAAHVRARKMLMAAAASIEAERRQQGPWWLKYGMVLVGLIGLAATLYGVGQVHSSSSAASLATATPAAKPDVNSLPQPIANFPGTVLGQFRISGNFDLSSLQHVTFTHNSVYLPVMKAASDTWPSVVVRQCNMSTIGNSLSDSLKDVGRIDMIPPSGPAAGVGKPETPSGWVVKDWSFYVTGNWGIVDVRWAPQASASESVTQLYAMFMPTGKASLVKTVEDKSGQETTVIAAGDGKVAVQTAVSSDTADASSQPALTLPIDVYTLSGTVPLQALSEPKHIPAPFGLMLKPVITGDRLVFQGIQGKIQSDVGTNAVWYTLSWDGQLARYDGAPMDGQPHWAVKGNAGSLWWVETTPDESDASSMQVLMSPLSGTGASNQTPAQTLEGSVKFFTASAGQVGWVQTTNNVTQLVIGELP